MRKPKAIFWDWNGTLVDDVAVCHALYLEEASIYSLTPYSLQEYRATFSFPVSSFYYSSGLPQDKKLYANLAHHFGVRYKEMWQHILLHKEVLETLRFFQTHNVQQYVISAYEHEALCTMVKEKGLTGFFTDIVGVTDRLAGSKAHLVSEVIRRHGLSGEEILFVGDTLHDEEVAQAAKIEVALIASGHMSFERLDKESHSALIFKELKDFMEWASPLCGG